MNIFRLIIILSLLTTSYLLLTTSVSADNLDSTNYRIKFSNINIAAGAEGSTSYNLNTSIGQTMAGQFDSTGYTVKAGFQYLNSIIPFRFSVSSININLGTLVPQTPSTASTVLTVSFGGAGQYQVTAIEDTTLKTLAGSSIPDTSCDSGTPCSKTSSNVWSSNSRYGFGYNMSGNDVPSDFNDNTYYRPFANAASVDTPVTVMSNTNVGRNRQATMTFKANISALQPQGSYQTVIRFIATPSY